MASFIEDSLSHSALGFASRGSRSLTILLFLKRGYPCLLHSYSGQQDLRLGYSHLYGPSHLLRQSRQEPSLSLSVFFFF